MTADSRLIAGDITSEIIGAAIDVHRALGPGLLESAYEECLCHELSLRGLAFRLTHFGSPLHRASMQFHFDPQITPIYADYGMATVRCVSPECSAPRSRNRSANICVFCG